MVAFLNHVYMLLWKNFKLQQRNKVRTVLEVMSPSFAFLILVIVRLSLDYYKVSPACQFKPTPLASKGPLAALRAFCYLGVCRQGEQNFSSEEGLFGDAEYAKISETMRNANRMLNNPVMQKLAGALLTLPSNMSDLTKTKKIPFHSLFSTNGSKLLDGVKATPAQRDAVMTAFVPFPKSWNMEMDGKIKLVAIVLAKTTETMPNLFCQTRTDRPGWSEVQALCQQPKFRENIKAQFDLDSALNQMTSNAADKFTIPIEASDAGNVMILSSQLQQLQADVGELFKQISPPLMSLSVKKGGIPQTLSTIGRIVCGKGINNIEILAEKARKIFSESSVEEFMEEEEKISRNASDVVNLTSIQPPEKFCYDRRYHRAIFGPFGTMASTLNYLNIVELVFGVIPYYPDTPTTRQFLAKLNSTLQNLSSLSYLAEDYTDSFRPSIVNFISNSSQIEGIKVMLLICEGLAQSSGSACRNVLKFLESNSSSTSQPLTGENSTAYFLNWKEVLNRIDPIMYRLYYITACFRLNKLYGFSNLESVDNYINFLIDELEENRQTNKPLFLASVLFDKQTAGFVKYRLRFRGAVVDSTRYFKVLSKGRVSVEPRKSFPRDFKYFTSFFLHIQELLEHGIQAVITGIDVPLQTYLNLFPSTCYNLDTFVSVITGFMPMIMTMSWIYNVSLLVNAIVYEKETRLKEMMKIMGLSDVVHWLSWFITSFIVMSVASILLTFVLKVGKLIVYSNPLLLFLFIISFVVSTICESFFISIFFSDSSVASAFAGVIYFLGYIPYVAIVRFSGSMSRPHYLLSCLIPQLAFGLGCSFIGIWEQNSVGLQTANFYEKTLASEDFEFGSVILMLWADSAIFMTLTWYLEKVFPGPYGVPKPWYFPCTRSFWRGSNQTQLQVDAGDDSSSNINKSENANSTGISCEETSLNSTPSSYNSSDSSGIKVDKKNPNAGNFEEEPIHLPVGITIRNLTKTYEPGLFACKRNAKPFTAVDNLSYNFYEGQVTSFLGHNGAGKSTTMSVLTGLYTPTFGTAYIAGYDIRTDMDKIRKHLGLCPQHNVLFDTLTVEDHIYFYGMLKGLSKAEVEPKIDEFIADVGLQKKRHEMSMNLSGGMKRKLSVAMAFVGGSKIVVLDEPTAGVDPHARRAIWDLLAKFRIGRTIVITTHHMDEADILGDRICIISQGRLVCSGSPMFLKKVFGEGYTLAMVKESMHCDVKAAFRLVQSVVPEAILGECTSSEIHIKLPYKAVPMLADLFVVLDKSMKSIHIVSYGIEDSSLEEIFLTVTSSKPKDTTESEENMRVTSIVPYRPSRRDSAFRIEQQQQVTSNNADAIQASSPPEEEGSLKSSASIGLRKTRCPIWQQVKALWIKRMHVMRRSKFGFVAEFILPAVFILLALALLQIAPSVGEDPPMELAPWYMLGKPSQALKKDLFVFQSRSLLNFPDNATLTNLSDRLMLHMNNTEFLGTSCMHHDLVRNPNLLCKPERKGSSWSPAPSNLPSNTSWCQCSDNKNPNAAKCVDWPAPAQRVLTSADKLESMQGYNLTNYIQSTVMMYYERRFGGYTMFINDTQAVNPQEASASLEAARLLKTISALTGGSERFIKLALASLESSQQPERLKSLANQIWFDNRGFVSGPAYLNILTNAVMRTLADKSLGPPEEIGVSGWTHPITSRSKHAADSIADNIYVSSITVVSIIFALSFIPASFMLFLISEKTTNAKHLQFVSGINPIVYWIVNHVWNLLNYLVPLTLLILLFVIFKNYEFVGKETIGPFLVTMIMFGFACAPIMYPFSWVMTVPSKAFTILTCLNLGLGFVTTMSVTIVAHIGATNEDPVMTNTANILKVAFLPLPHFCLGQALMELMFYYQSVIVLGNYLKKTGIKPTSVKLASSIEIHYSGWTATRRYILCMLAHSIVYFILVLLMEYNCCCKQGLVSSRFYRIFYRAKYDRVMQPPDPADVDDDVRAEAAKVEEGAEGGHLLELRRLMKIFSTSSGPKAAVKGISLGVKSHECFGFLGVNGAGKTTTFKMLTGDLVPTSGDALIGGFSILTEAIEVHKQLGYCPQFDALLPLLTGRETLQLYARIRAVGEADIDELVEFVARKVGLEVHLDKTTQEYSGGNKRKLSCGIAFIGNPPIVFLDEPTAGMDPGARRFLWRCIQRMVAAGSCIILTTHSMEDCQALCHRLTIMVNGRLQCIGSPQHLKNKFGQGFTVFLRVRQGRTVATAADSAAEAGAGMEAHLKRAHDAFVAAFPDSTLNEGHASVLQYQLKQTVQLRNIFAGVQMLKDQNLILDYSVNQTTLDHIFINFAKKQN